jgi:NAD(P)-dependent dehydrogenase (short-subunit alcohol dehydrogenase family)
MDLGLNGTNAVVTGASRGIGLAVTRALVAEGGHIVAGARDIGGDLAALAGTGQVQPVAVDLSTASGAQALAAAAAEHGPVQVLVNNVGAVHPRLDGFLAITDEEWLQTWTLDFLAAVRMCRAVLPSMLAAQRGAIVNVVSVNAFLPDPAVIDYCAAKAALGNFSKALALEVGGRGVRVNAVSPGPVSTGLWLGKGGVAATVAGAQGVAADDVAAQAASQAVTGRFTDPAEVADLVVLLAGNRAANVVGSDFVIDGGHVKTIR